MNPAIVALALLAAIGPAVNGQQPAPAAKPTNETFHWNAKDLQVLDSEDSIKASKTLSLAERQALIKAIVGRLKKYEVRTSQEWWTTAENTRIRLVDLNGDGVSEVIAQGSGDLSCSPTGNCDFWVFSRVGETYKLILEREAIQTFTVQPTLTNGFHDLVLGMHGSATEQELFVYRFIGGRYQRSACYNANWQRLAGDKLQHLKEPALTPCGP
jgi:hypothetical protein